MLKDSLKNIPSLPGVYIFKTKNKKEILYIGKAKNLKKRVSSYFQKKDTDWKVRAILDSSDIIEHIVTKSELEAMLLEAELIKANQPKFNVLLKSGQPFLYILITSVGKKIPEIKVTRNKKEKGSYFGPFLEKTSVRKVYSFLIKTFKLKLCGKKIENGCLDYHLGKCAGSCKGSFDVESYLERLNLAKVALQKGHKKFLQYLENEISKYNSALEFEKSKEFYDYYLAFKSVFFSLDEGYSFRSENKSLSIKDIWILNENGSELFLFKEKNGVLKKREFYHILDKSLCEKYVESYYRQFLCSGTILTNFNLQNKDLLESFLTSWHKKEVPVSILNPDKGHFLNLVRLAEIQLKQELEKQKNIPKILKRFFGLEKEPRTIDCFDISQKQGMFMVGSCVRFKDGKPDKNNFRRFKIKTVKNQDDYACLQEIVKRRYSDISQIPDLVLIDGGKGQLGSVRQVLPDVQIISLAKKDEVVFSDKLLEGKKLDMKSASGLFLTAIRDYAHHFAISYHRNLAKIK